MGDVWVGVVWACILTLVWLRGKIRVGEWCCEVVGSCEVELSCEVWCSTSSQPDKNLYMCVSGCTAVCMCLYVSLYVYSRVPVQAYNAEQTASRARWLWSRESCSSTEDFLTQVGVHLHAGWGAGQVSHLVSYWWWMDRFMNGQAG